MAQYVLQPSSFQPGMVASQYNLGLSDGTRTYGYLLQNNPQKGFQEASDVTSKSSLIQYSSPNTIDRDLVFFPRYTQGDYSGGLLQVAAIDVTKEFDSDLEIRTPGYLTLRPAWKRTTLAGSVGTYQCVAYGGNVYTVWGVSQFYDAFGVGRTPSPAMNATLIDSDGNVLYLADGVNTLLSWNGTSFTTLSTSIGAIKQMWYIDLGTNGRFIYYTTDAQTLNRFDLNTLTSSAVSLAGQTWSLIDICVYQTGIAITTRGMSGGGTGGYSDIWFHDGQNLTRIVTLDEYEIVGICNCLGSLFATAYSTGGFEAPALIRIDAGTFTIVVSPGSPLAGATSAKIGAPNACGPYVNFALTNPQINNISAANYIGVYDSIVQSFSHIGNFGSDDAPQVSQPRQLACSGRAVVFPMSTGGNTVIQFQTNSSLLPSGNLFASSGWLVSSRLDFATPGIAKRFRRIEVVHSPLASGESITVEAFVDQDPLAFTTALTPVPSSATVINNALNSTTTVLTMGVDTVGKTIYYALNLQGNGSSSPKIRQVAVEIGGTWTWNVDLNCTSIRRRLDGSSDDAQGVTGKDLYFLLRNAYENGSTLTILLANGLSYTVAIESLQANSPGYVDHSDLPVRADEEWLVNAVLRQAA